MSLLDITPIIIDTLRGDSLDYCNILDVYLDNETCLLYTSPSPRDLSTSRMPSSA